MCKGSQTTTTNSAPPPQVMAEYEKIMGRANDVASTPYQQYGGNLVAGFTPDQQSAFGTVNNAQGISQPYFNTATNYATQGAAPISAAQIQNYSNPFQNQVVNATLGQMNLLNAQQQNQLTSGVAGSGGLFNDRYGVAQAQLAGQQATNEAPTIAGLNAQNYSQALGAAQADRSAYQNAAYTFGNLGTSNLNAILTGAQAQLGTGGQQQQLAQQQLNVPYMQFQQQQAFPYQQTGWLAGVDTGVGSNMGGTSSTTGPPPNQTSAFLGAGLAGLAFLNRGGGINRPHYDDGGGVPAMPYGAAGPMFGGATSYVPSMQIAHGSGPPKPPGISTPQTPNLGQAIGQYGNITKAAGKAKAGISDAFNRIDPPMSDVQQAGLDAGLTPDEVGFGVEGAFRRGGGIDRPHYDDGGGVPDDWKGYLPISNEVMPPDESPVRQPIALPSGLADMAAAPASSPGISRPSWAGAVGAGGFTPTPATPWPGEAGSAPTGNYPVPTGIDTSTPAAPEKMLNAQQTAPVYTGGDRQHALSYGAGVVSMDRAKNAIGTFESGNNYSEVGPPTKLGRALGRYQVMEKELPGQLKQAGLPPMTPTEFLRDPKAQDKLFETVFGGLMDKHGNFNDAASMWFSGRPVAQAGNRKDVLGTTVPMYLANTNAILAKDQGDTVSPNARQPRAGTATLGDSNVVPFERASTRKEEREEEKRSGLFGLNLSPELRQGMLTAGFSMMANRSPFLGVAVGDAGLAGVGAYQGAKTYAANQNLEERKLGLSEKAINARLAQLDNAAKASAARIDAATKRQGEIDRHNVERERQQAEAIEQGRMPVGYRWQDDADHRKGMEPIPHGPADPATIGAAAAAKKPQTGEAFSDDTVKLMAQGIRAGNSQVLVNLGAGAMKAENVARVWNEVSRGIVAEGGTGADLSAARANFNAQMQAAKSQAVRSANVEANIEEARQTFPLAREASHNLSRTDFVPLNRAIQMVQSGTSSPALRQFVTANAGVITAYSQAMARSGVATVDGRHAAEALLSTADGPEAYETVLQQMEKEMHAAAIAPEMVREQILSRISGRPAQPAQAGAAANAAPGTHTVPPAGAVEYLRRNPGTHGLFDQKYGAGASTQILGQ